MTKPGETSAAVLVDYDKPLDVRTLPIPDLEPKAALVRVAASTMCGTDVHIFHGDYAKAGPSKLPLVPGHEIVGRIVALGSDATFPAAVVMQVISGAGKAVSQNVGLAGGYPGSSQVDIAVRAANVHSLFATGVIPSSLQQIEGDVQILACEDEALLSPGDVHCVSWQSGGGYGDPLLRDPVSVAHDVAEFRVSRGAARTIYGVVLDDTSGHADLSATEHLRAEMKQIRRDRAQKAVAR